MDLPTRFELEDKFNRDFKRVSQAHRQELLTLAGKPPDFRRVPVSFWKKVGDEEAAILIILLSDIYRLNAMQHGMNGQSANVFSISFALRRATEVSREYAQNSLARAMTAQRQAVQAGKNLTQATAGEIANRIFGSKRDQNLVATEFTTASVGGGETAMQIRGLTSPQDLWIIHPGRSKSGVCKRCEPFHMTTRTFWARVFPNGPPVHKSCCCEIQYVNA